MENILSSSNSSTKNEGVVETPYVLPKKTWIKYDMGLTRNNLDEFLSKYFEAKTRCLCSIEFCSKGLIADISPTKIINTGGSSDGGFTSMSNSRIDAENFLKRVTPIINNVKATFTKTENNYFEYCLLSNNSEDSFRKYKLNDISKNGLKPIKYSCILKLALPLGLDVLKKGTKGGDDIDCK